MGLISNGTTLLDAGAINDGIATGNMILIKTLTASNSATLSFVHGASSVVLDGTYKSYVFKFIDIHAETDNVHFQVNFRDGGTAYDATKTTTVFRAYNAESDAEAGLDYDTNADLAQATGVQFITRNQGNDNDQSCSGTLHLFEPASTTFVKHFFANSSVANYANYQLIHYVGGYCNVTAAIDGVQFSFSSGNIDAGTIKLYGIT